ncbi:CHAD domain-containing protein [Streptomyces sp. NEAU-Y11]|uniref:CHAD domain-containing protein n=1 Tax=Streptomyces cucumeris TaxID=2962890 RepID=UPI0020C8FD09|nr:CHAD domain-containing protein [Streptomyces sp. NEAU-Y11]MCP9206964.1 CHAD domain-containing protein [Streptomyces sp. NEAU-Y11]
MTGAGQSPGGPEGSAPPGRPGPPGGPGGYETAERVAAPGPDPHPVPAAPPPTAGEVLASYLNAQAGDFLRSLRLHRESGSDVEAAAEAARQLRRAARRISGALSVYRPLTDTAWSDELRAELAWLSGSLALEHAYTERLSRLRGALQRLSGAGGPPDRPPAEARAEAVATAATAASGTVGAAGAASAGSTAAAARPARAARRTVSLATGGPDTAPPAPRGGPADGTAPAEKAGETTGHTTDAPATAPQRAGGGADGGRGAGLTVGAARAGALLERQLTLARTRAHTAALQALGSSRFHAVADTVALLASEVPLEESAAAHPAEQTLTPLAEMAHRRLAEAVEALPLGRAGHPYNAEALVHGLAATPAADAPPASEQQDAPWHQVRRLLRMRRYALEVLEMAEPPRGAPWVTGAPDEEPETAGGAAGPVNAPAELPPSVRLLAAARALERHRDASEAAAAAAAAARTPRIAPATAYALGVLHADQRHEVEAARFAFGRIWRHMAAGPV